MGSFILVTGSEGLVGSRFLEISESRNIFHAPNQIEMDITKPLEIKAIIKSYDFKALVHFAAYTDVGGAEKQRGDKNADCWVINVEGTRNLVEAIAPHKEKIHFIHISTDMVFAGRAEDPGPYSENHPLEKELDKLTWYGHTKSEAEKIVREVLGDRTTIVRLIYPVRASFEGKLDYIRKPLKLFDEGRLYPLFSDQQISITFIDEACQAIDAIIKYGHRGVFHTSSQDTSTPYELISYVLEKTRGVKNAVKPIKLKDFLKKQKIPEYRYPKYGGLKVETTEKILGQNFSTWRQIVDKMILQGLGNS